MFIFCDPTGCYNILYLKNVKLMVFHHDNDRPKKTSGAKSELGGDKKPFAPT